MIAGGYLDNPELDEVIWGHGGDSKKKFLCDKVTVCRKRWDWMGDRLELVGSEVSYAGAWGRLGGRRKGCT